MRSIPPLGLGAVLLAAAWAAACNSTLGPPTASDANVVDTVTLSALTGTAVGSPSGYVIRTTPGTVRTDSSADFDFVFDMVGSQGRLYPPGALAGLSRSAALQYAGSFDGTLTAPTNGWNDSTALNVDSGTVVLVRSQIISCVNYAATVFEYAKLQLLAVDTIARTIRFQILADANCGYRDLNNGIPQH